MKDASAQGKLAQGELAQGKSAQGKSAQGKSARGKCFLVIDEGRVLYRSKDRAQARAYQQGWDSTTAAVVRVVRVWPREGRELLDISAGGDDPG